MTLELGQTPTQTEVFARTHTRKEDRGWVDKRSKDVDDVFIEELKRLQKERQAIIDAGGPEPPRSTRTRCGHGLRAAARGGGFMAWVWFPPINTHTYLQILRTMTLLVVHLTCSTGIFHSRRRRMLRA
ncbi:hypothetical protein PIB30_069397 [Stylosanthes scabra]|uniref:Uncharacterized protein n=1 Tax=Stylosanthes scabra TaxID=79078 RepID=A0ABU6SNA2_9FABA|nr:hypothetical protein [Stylosanthes scabra]